MGGLFGVISAGLPLPLGRRFEIICGARAIAVRDAVRDAFTRRRCDGQKHATKPGYPFIFCQVYFGVTLTPLAFELIYGYTYTFGAFLN